MSIATKLNSIVTSLQAIRTAIINKGQSVPSGTDLADWASKINAIETGGSMEINGQTIVSGVAGENIDPLDVVVRINYPEGYVAEDYTTSFFYDTNTKGSAPADFVNQLMNSFYVSEDLKVLTVLGGTTTSDRKLLVYFKNISDVWYLDKTIDIGTAHTMCMSTDGSRVFVGADSVRRVYHINKDDKTCVLFQDLSSVIPVVGMNNAVFHPKNPSVLFILNSSASLISLVETNGAYAVTGTWVVSGMYRCAISPNGLHFVTISTNGNQIIVYSTDGHNLLFRCSMSPSGGTSTPDIIKISNDGKWVLSSDCNNFASSSRRIAVLMYIDSSNVGSLKLFKTGSSANRKCFITLDSKYAHLGVSDCQLNQDGTVTESPMPNTFTPVKSTNTVVYDSGIYLSGLIVMSSFAILRDIRVKKIIPENQTTKIEKYNQFTLSRKFADIGYVPQAIAKDATGNMISIARNTALYPEE